MSTFYHESQICRKKVITNEKEIRYYRENFKNKKRRSTMICGSCDQMSVKGPEKIKELDSTVFYLAVWVYLVMVGAFKKGTFYLTPHDGLYST